MPSEHKELFQPHAALFTMQCTQHDHDTHVRQSKGRGCGNPHGTGLTFGKAKVPEKGMSSRVPSDDPRRPQAVHKFYRSVRCEARNVYWPCMGKERLDPDQVPPDYFSLLALAFGISGLMLKLKACAWLSVFACMVSVANMKQSEVDFKQLACSIMFSTMTVIMNYTAAGTAHKIPPGPGGATSPPVPPAV